MFLQNLYYFFQLTESLNMDQTEKQTSQKISYLHIAEIFRDHVPLLDTVVGVKGWVKTCRDQKNMIFIHLSDGTDQRTLQVIADPALVKDVAMRDLAAITTGTSLHVRGILVKSPAKGQAFELSAREVVIDQICPVTFPFQKTGLTMEFMRGYPHLRQRSNIMRAVFKLRSVVTMAIHEFLQRRDYIFLDIPVITTNACEGGCQPLQVTSLLVDGKASKIPTKTIPRVTDPLTGLVTVETITDDIDFKKDFFCQPVYLTVSNQLHLEALMHGLGYVYTMTPASRGEPSQTTKHLAHFTMMEYEGIFDSLSENIDTIESLMKYCAQKVLTDCVEELRVLAFATPGLVEKLKKMVAEPFVRIQHRDAVRLLKKMHTETPFSEMPEFAGDLSGEMERALVRHFAQPVVVMCYPKAVKAFYMPVDHVVEEDGTKIEYVACYDLLTDIGETVGGSQRITDEAELVARMRAQGMDPSHLDWYVQLRRYGTISHGGCGLGVERFIAYLAGLASVQDACTYPITVKHCTY